MEVGNLIFVDYTDKIFTGSLYRFTRTLGGLPLCIFQRGKIGILALGLFKHFYIVVAIPINMVLLCFG